MTKYSFILLSQEKENFINTLSQIGVFDITRSSKAIDEPSQKILQNSEELQNIINSLSTINFDKDDNLDSILKIKDTLKGEKILVDQAKQLLEDFKNWQTETKVLEKQHNEIYTWGNFDIEKLNKLSELGYVVRYYKLAKKKLTQDLQELYPLEIISEYDSNIYFVTISDKEDYNFPIEELDSPKCDNKEICDKIEQLEQKGIKLKAQLLLAKDSLEQYKDQQESLKEEFDLYLAKESSEKTVEDYVSVFTGFIPSECENDVTESLDKAGVFYIKEKAELEDNPPIQLKNNRFTAMFSMLTDMYGRPAYDEFDPTPFISVFFLLFFAMCMGDAGYGLVLILVGLLLGKNENFKKMSPLVCTLGIATFFVGFAFHTFFSIDIAKWEIIPKAIKKIMLPSKIAGYDGTMVLAIIIGVIHICLAMIVKAVNDTRKKGFKNSLSTYGWNLLIIGSLIVGGISLAGVIDQEITKWIIIGIGGISAIGIFLLNDLKRNPLLNIGAGLWETYNTATGLLGDVLSYLRLYALGLAGSMLGFAFNDLGKMVLGDGSNAFMWIFFLLIVIVGHTLNIAMAALGAFVHPLRLNFLEFFKNSGYEGSGRNYSPIRNKYNKQ